MKKTTTPNPPRIRLDNDCPSFEEIVSRYSPDVLRLSMILMQNQEEAKDILQESLLRLVRAIQQGAIRSQNGSIKGYLLKIARNICIDKLRNRIRWSALEEGDQNWPPSFRVEDTPDRVSQDRQFYETFNRALQELNSIQRTILVLHDVQEESYEEIAQALHLTVNNVRTHLWRAREKMRRLLAPYIQQDLGS